jgi:transposase InsO family protein
MNLSRSTFYKGCKGDIQQIREEQRALLRAEIEEVLAEWPFYGYRRVTRELRRRGIVVNHKKVARIMREEALTPRRVRRFITTTDSGHGDPVYPNLAGDILPTGPDQLWVADLTYIRLQCQRERNNHPSWEVNFHPPSQKGRESYGICRRREGSDHTP